MLSEDDAFELVKNLLAYLYVGRSFELAGCPLTPAQAFSPEGALPLFVARAARTFRQVYLNGIQLERCLRCGAERPPETACEGPCPLKDGERRVTWPFTFALSNDERYLLKVSTGMQPYQSALKVALFFLFDAAQEVLLASPDPRVIQIDELIEDLAAEINPLVEKARSDLTRQPAPAGVVAVAS